MMEHPSEERKHKLIKALMEQKHGSPFEDGYFRFYIAAPRGVRDEHVRHRAGWSFSSASSRYREIPPTYYIPPKHRPLKKVQGFKKMNPEYEPLDDTTYEVYEWKMREMYIALRSHQLFIQDTIDATEAYRWANPDGQIIPYIARCNPRSLMHFLSLRTHDKDANHVSFPMWEIEQIARQMEQQFAEHLPITYHYYNALGREAP